MSRRAPSETSEPSTAVRTPRTHTRKPIPLTFGSRGRLASESLTQTQSPVEQRYSFATQSTVFPTHCRPLPEYIPTQDETPAMEQQQQQPPSLEQVLAMLTEL